MGALNFNITGVLEVVPWLISTENGLNVIVVVVCN
jgi:hypothetical protein